MLLFLLYPSTGPVARATVLPLVGLQPAEQRHVRRALVAGSARVLCPHSRGQGRGGAACRLSDGQADLEHAV